MNLACFTTAISPEMVLGLTWLLPINNPYCIFKDLLEKFTLNSTPLARRPSWRLLECKSKQPNSYLVSEGKTSKINLSVDIL
ncbi:MAG: hypothetical protein QXQ11_02000 [Candidatus Bathyarchaeia archaeon]